MFKVMVVDDETIMHNILKDYISKFHPDLRIAEDCYSGEEALSRLAASEIDIVITDIKMPEMDGMQLIREIHEKYPECIILILSAYGEFDYAQEAIAAGVFKYMLKPIDFDLLSDTLKTVVQKLNRLSHSSGAEQLLSELIFGTIGTKNQLDEAASECGLRDLDKKRGGLYRFHVLPCKSLNEWKYGLDTIENVLVNIVKFFTNGTGVYMVARKNLTFYMVSLSEEPSSTSFDLNQLTEYIYTETGFNCSIELIDEFESLYELVDDTRSDMKYEPDADAGNDRENLSDAIKIAIEYMNNHYARDISRNEISELVHMSPEYFSQYFRKETGTTFLQYLTKLRISKAAEYIENGEKISDVIQKVGYASKNRFYANFKYYTSYTPKEYRRIRSYEKQHLSEGDKE